jgi:hypothetical protein
MRNKGSGRMLEHVGYEKKKWIIRTERMHRKRLKPRRWKPMNVSWG